MQEDDPALAFPVGRQQTQMFRVGQTLSIRRQTFSLRHLYNKEEQKYGDFSILKKILSLGKKEWWIIMMGVIAATISGAAFPLFAIMFGGVFEVFSKPTRNVFSLIHPWCAGLILLGAGIGAAMFIKVSYLHGSQIH